MIKNLLCAAALMLCFGACGNKSGENNADSADSTKNETQMQDSQRLPAKDDAKVLIHTSEGDITVLLYGDTPRHRDNFLKLVEENFYDSTLFHRVINEFMVQAGDPDSKTAKPGQQLGSGDPGYTIPAEFYYPHHFHKRGALSAARTGDQVNPKKESSGSQFYIVTGKKYSAAELSQMSEQMKQQAMYNIFDSLANQNMDQIRQMQQAQDNAGLTALKEKFIAQAEEIAAKGNYSIPADVAQVYETVGGTPFLDGQYTVFGEVLSGMDVVEKIEKAQTDRNDRPTSDIRILSAEVIK
jgi:cyclophilin family peptidyl-prolyl cis-trans isomerase